MSRIGITYTGNQRMGPRWLADFGSRDHLLVYPAKLDPAGFRNRAGVQVRVAAIAAIGATSITIDALASGDVSVTLASGNVLIPAGTVLDFGGAKFARLTADAVAGATTLTVAALVTALAVGDRAVYSLSGRKLISSGSFVGRTYAERDAMTPFGAWATGDDEVSLTLFDSVAKDTLSVDVELVRPGSIIKENYLPDWPVLTGGEKTALRANFRCITGVD